MTYNDAPGNLDTKALFVSAGDIYIGKYGDGAPSNLSRYRGSICANDNIIIKGSLGPPRKPEFIRVTTDSPPFTVASQVDDGSGGKPESKYNSVLFEGTITAFNDGSDPKWNIGTQIYWDQAFVFDCNTYKPMGCYAIEAP